MVDPYEIMGLNSNHDLIDPAHGCRFEPTGGSYRSPALHQDAFGFLAHTLSKLKQQTSESVRLCLDSCGTNTEHIQETA